MRRVVPLIVALLGCRQILGIEPVSGDLDDASTGDTASPRDVVSETEAADGQDAQVDWSERVARIERSCALLTSCSQGVGAMSFADCVRRHITASLVDLSDHPIRSPAWSCLAAASRCADIDKCVAGATAPTACAASGSGTTKICVGDQVVTCSSGTNVGAELCVLEGRSCAASSPTTAACVASTGCTATAPANCVGPRLSRCIGTLDQGARCDLLGGICENAMGAAGCTGDDRPCSGSAVACDGSRATVCRYGREAKYECAALFSRCSPTADASMPCVPLGAACSDSDPPRCDGASITYCLGGLPRQMNCVAIGLGACRDTATLGGPSVACERT